MGPERHAFSLRPEVIKIPFIIHVPKHIEKNWFYDQSAIAFNTDIPSTLYELLGHGPVINRPEFGRPLFTRASNDATKYYRNSYMIASSYGPLYGLLSENGSKLFIENEASGIADTEEFFDLSQDPQATQNLLTDEIRRNSEAELRRCIQQIADLYGYRYKVPSIFDWLTR
jgi:arylsulfatase A-like enzyme